MTRPHKQPPRADTAPSEQETPPPTAGYQEPHAPQEPTEAQSQNGLDVRERLLAIITGTLNPSLRALLEELVRRSIEEEEARVISRGTIEHIANSEVYAIDYDIHLRYRFTAGQAPV